MHITQVSNEPLLSILHNAHNIELKMINELKKYLTDTEDFPVIRSQVNQQINLTEQNARKIEQWIQIVSGKFSPVEEAVSALIELAKTISTDIAADNFTRRAIADFVTGLIKNSLYEGSITAEQELYEEDINADTYTDKEYEKELEAFMAMTPLVVQAEQARSN